MLAQILHDLYVPRELLDGLPEDQKQLLFCKMREEQIRRYHEREEEEAAAALTTTIQTNKKKKNSKRVTFRLGANGHEWCSVVGESDISSRNLNDQLNNKRTQIEKISNNIQEARRIFERLESDAQRLVPDKESELLQQSKSSPSPQISQNDVIDEMFYLEVEERAKKAEQERREIARRARDSFHRNSSQLNICFDTDNHTTILLQSPPLNSSDKINRESTNNKQIHIELIDKKTSPIQSSKEIVEHERSKPILPLTREDIRQWFCTSEIPYNTFRSTNGHIYPWFHGIISRAYAEQLLSTKPIGSYLVRVNEKIFGYALSYRASDHCRHLLIEVILSSKHDDNRKQTHVYRFLGGAKQEIFTHLNELIEKYSNNPIRPNSTDVLRYPCGQIDSQKPDYADLFLENRNDKQYDSLYISLQTTTSPPRSTTHL
ncbi:hypothetical protein I4U23_020587 [Adineta vaga]|nr:hypothetical protein I4U23_020587 [Adineta vaga]